MPYLDHAATTPLRPEALEAMLPHLRDGWANPSSLHGPGRRARVAVEHARVEVAAVLECEPGEVVFTSGGTESDNAAIRGVLTGKALRATGRPGLVTSSAEHHAVLDTARALEAEGHPVTVLEVDGEGRVSPESVLQTVTDETGLVSLMLVNNEIGTVHRIRDVATALQGRSSSRAPLVHTDAVQAAGLLPLGVDDLEVDLLSLSGHKVGGPKGVGALYVRSGTPFSAMQTGGAQERGRRGGTENVAAIVGFATALRLAEADRVLEAERLSRLRDELRSRLGAAFGDQIVVNTPSEAAPHILNVSFRPGPSGPLDGEMLLTALDLEGVHASAGSACTSGALEPSHVVTALGLGRETAAATVRLSLGRTTTAADLEDAVGALTRVVRRLDPVIA
ncbi:cysteine desulfurase family protein [Rubrivirga sp.]|uniref:cysteine desulfurase family protein n=1 Tax=Rubrivirga sp. TaxID=1885344 RepID=UPI003C76E5B4